MEQTKQPHLKLVTCALLMSNIMAGLDGTIVNTAMPAITSDLHGLQYMGWIVATFLLGMSVSTPLWSKFGEHVGNKIAFLTATTLFLLATIAQGTATSIQFFIAARTIMGIGAGGMNTIPMIAYGFLYSNLHDRAKVIGLSSAFFNTASIIGPLLGGWLVDNLNWRWVFFVNIPIAVVAMTIVAIFFHASHHAAAGKPFDYAGATLLVLGLCSILGGIELIGSVNGLDIVALCGGGLLMLVGMAIMERKADDPVIPGRLFTNKKLMVDFSLFVIMWGSFIAFLTYIPMWAQGILGLSAFLGGVTQIPGALTDFGGAWIVAFVEDKWPKYWMVTGGVLMLTIAYAILLITGQSTPFWLLLTAGAFEGFAVGFNFNILQMSVQTDVPIDDMPVATSTAYLLRILSQTMMSAVYGVVLTNALNHGVRTHHGITMGMLNRLSNAKTAVGLPKAQLPEMRHILFQGYYNIIVVAFILIIICLALSVTVAIRHSRKQKLAEQD